MARSGHIGAAITVLDSTEHKEDSRGTARSNDLDQAVASGGGLKKRSAQAVGDAVAPGEMQDGRHKEARRCSGASPKDRELAKPTDSADGECRAAEPVRARAALRGAGGAGGEELPAAAPRQAGGGELGAEPGREQR
eukprot:CAMPEP_0171245460 /NCGR_PEP_ID=MMETSP0790-20130122/47435_1 /TAXON_ID=2925 /ORGANISM="Alexandrium catenella, Strain OF101" /LENGTH=136 /DNA_ID=CAMNT_0011712727 /DNA_START=68 /DNA_END=474 /DNA_ORIENTATION=+